MKFFVVGFAAGCLLFFFFISLGFGSKTRQPISFNHKKHLDQGLECDSCHRYFKTQNFSGIPDISICMECHKEAITKNPEEEKIRQFAEKGEGISWKQIYKEPDHVFFSHRRHVVLGKADCKNCHGNIGQREEPPSKPWIKMSMKWCMDCHTKKKVTNDCLSCHV